MNGPSLEVQAENQDNNGNSLNHIPNSLNFVDVCNQLGLCGGGLTRNNKTSLQKILYAVSG